VKNCALALCCRRFLHCSIILNSARSIDSRDSSKWVIHCKGGVILSSYRSDAKVACRTSTSVAWVFTNSIRRCEDASARHPIVTDFNTPAGSVRKSSSVLKASSGRGASANARSSAISRHSASYDQSSDFVTEVGAWVTAGKSALDLLKSAWSLMPKGEERNALEQKIEEAEQALKKSDAKLAKELGYKLCECTFPPQIMLWKEQLRAHVCPNQECGRRIDRRKPVNVGTLSTSGPWDRGRR